MIPYFFPNVKGSPWLLETDGKALWLFSSTINHFTFPFCRLNGFLPYATGIPAQWANTCTKSSRITRSARLS